MPALRNNDAILSQVGSECTGRHCALPDQKAAGPVQHQEGLILLRLDRNKAHAWARDGSTDGCRIGGIVLRAAAHEGFYVAWWNEAHLMTERS